MYMYQKETESDWKPKTQKTRSQYLIKAAKPSMSLTLGPGRITNSYLNQFMNNQKNGSIMNLQEDIIPQTMTHH